jgi:hypothetical protein
LRTRVRKALAWGTRERRRFDSALRKLSGKTAHPPGGHPSRRPAAPL